MRQQFGLLKPPLQDLCPLGLRVLLSFLELPLGRKSLFLTFLLFHRRQVAIYLVVTSVDNPRHLPHLLAVAALHG
jgi:hypothetical protein